MIRIIGAGFSGLSLAYHFVKQGYSVTVIDKNERPGGVIHTEIKNGILVESAANGLLASKKIEELFADIGLKPLQTKPDSRRKYIYRNGLRRWPLTFGESIRMAFRLLFAFILRTHTPRPHESLKQWAERVLGEAADLYLVQPMVNGIFAEETKHLNASLVLKSMFYPKVKGHLRGLLSAYGGMGELIASLEKALREKGVTFQYGTNENFDPQTLQHNTFSAVNFSNVVSAIDFKKNNSPSTNKNGLESRSLARVTIHFKQVREQIDGFGVLFPNCEKFNSLGVLANSKIFENRGDYNESWIFSDSTLPQLMEMTDLQIKEKIIQDRKRIFSSEFEIDEIHIHRWKSVIPSYNHELLRFLHENSEMSWKLAGNYLGVLGLTGIHERNRLLVDHYIKENRGKR